MALAVLAAACGPAPPPRDRAAVDSALDARYATFSDAYAQASVQLLMEEVYAEDGYYLPPGSPILHGQDQFRGQFSFLERYARDDGPGPQIAFEIVDRDVDGDLAYDIGIYTLRPPDAADDAAGSRGKFVVIWKRVDGEWRIWADAFSPMGETPG
jgi:ketosteroid isomerase-like protein